MRAVLKILTISALAPLLAACGVQSVPDGLESVEEQGNLSVVTVSAVDSAESVSASYGAEVVVWRPDAGFAVLANATVPSGDFRSLGVAVEPNAGQVGTPGTLTNRDTTAQAWKVWSGAWKVWSGAWKVWSGGDEGSLFPSENHGAWQQIGLFEAHQLAPSLGAGVKVAVIDTGIDLEHPVFAGSLAPEGEWFDFVDGDSLPQEVPAAGEIDAYGHGTSVAGIIRQIAPNAVILPLRALAPDGSGEIADVAAAIDHALRQGADVINLSLGTQAHSPVLARMVELAASQGVYVLSAAGNSGNQRLLYPASSSTQPGETARLGLGTGSVDAADIKADYSNYGQRLELLAPGVEIYSAAPEERLAAWSGTSMSTAVVSGILALGAGEKPGSLSLAEAVAATAVGVDDLNPDYAGKLGEGRVDAAAFLSAILD
jgi:thermitase